MARYKTLQALAHNVCASFASGLNWGDGDHVLAEAFRACRIHRADSFNIDLLTGKCSPPSDTVASVREAAQRYSSQLPGWAAELESDAALIDSATLMLRFAPRSSTTKATVVSPGIIVDPPGTFLCRVELIDDRGRRWSSEREGPVEFTPRWGGPGDGLHGLIGPLRRWMHR